MLYKQACAAVEQEEEELSRVKENLDNVFQAQSIFQKIGQTLQQQTHQQISQVVSRCLRAVFGSQAYDFRVDFQQKRGRTEARLVFERDGVEYDDPLNEIGGGVVDVAALALRLACILLTRPALRRLLVLDEPFNNIRGEGNRKRTRDLLLRLSEELQIQIIINTDISAYRMGEVIELS